MTQRFHRRVYSLEMPSASQQTPDIYTMVFECRAIDTIVGQTLKNIGSIHGLVFSLVLANDA